MRLTDTHSHLYAPEFDADREEALARAADAGVERVLLPAIDSESHERLFGLCRSHPERCVPMMGLHPTSVHANPHWREELALVERYLETPPAGIRFCAVGEIGLDLYWRRYFRAEQLEAFRRQIDLSLEYGLPIAVHTMQLRDIVLETDCPYLTPAPHRGERNESAYVRYVCEKVAELKGLTPGETAEATTANAERIFGK